MYPEKDTKDSMATIDRVAMLRRKINHLKAMFRMEKELFLKEDLRARKMEME